MSDLTATVTATPTSYLVTGASRGLGLQLVRQLLDASPLDLVIAAARDPASSPGLLALAQQYGIDRLQTVALDVTSEGSIAVGFLLLPPPARRGSAVS